MSICMQIINFIIHFFLKILQFKESCKLRDPEFWQMWWWNINNNVSFRFRLSPRKTNMTKFFKKSKKLYFGAILGPFCPNFGKNESSWKKGLCQSLNISVIIVALYQKSEISNEPFLRKMLNCWTDRQQWFYLTFFKTGVQLSKQL